MTHVNSGSDTCNVSIHYYYCRRRWSRRYSRAGSYYNALSWMESQIQGIGAAWDRILCCAGIFSRTELI